MRFQKILRLFLCFVLLTPTVAPAFETDQYNLPVEPLADIGDEVSDYAEQNVRKAVDKTNAEILARESCLERIAVKSKCGSPDEERTRLGYLRSEAAIAREVFKLLGGGIPPFTNSGTWMESHRFKAQPARYKTSFGKSIFTRFPTDYLTISETVNLYGAQFGTDKIAHLFQQGYSYYRIYERAITQGLSTEEAARRAVRWGQKTERTIYGTLISGVYSNADLCANFAGMKFYQGLTRKAKIGGETRSPILILRGGVWAFGENINLRESLLKPFVSDHFNEALNPSIFTRFLGLRSSVRQTVRKQSCPQWRRQYPNSSQADFARISEDLKLWYGEDYGHTESRNFIRIAETCFGGEMQKADSTD